MYSASYSVFSATINVTYTEGATCTCSNGDVTLTAADTTGFYAFNVGRTGTWTVKIEKEGEDAKSTTVEITSNGQTESVEITFIPIVPWSTGSDEDIAAMLQAHYEGKINIWDYWEIGQERVVHLNAISGGGIVNEDQPEQDTTWVLMHNGGFELTAGGYCAAVVSMKDCLNTTVYLDRYDDSGHPIDEFWKDSPYRTWLNSNFPNGMPIGFRSLFKQFKVTTATSELATGVTDDYFVLPAEKEVFGTKIASVSNEADLLFQLEIYKTTVNRIKRVAGRNSEWYNRSKQSTGDGNWYFLAVKANGDPEGLPTFGAGISPFGVI